MIDHISCNILLPLPVTKTRTAITTGGESRWEGDIPCRNVPAGKAEQKQFEDGAVRTYSATIRLDAECREFTVGDRVKLFLSGDIVRECEVKGFHRYQLYAKLWV